jgi:hypothetical protein
VKPVLQALILADHIYDDRLTGKKVISGTFNQLSFAKVPKRQVTQGGQKKVLVPPGGQIGSPWLYISLTDFRGKARFDIRYVDLKDNKVLFGTAFEAQWDDPLATAEFVLPMPPLPASREGVFALELLCNNELLGALRVRVQEVKGN